MDEAIVIPIAGMVFTLAVLLGVPLVWAKIRRGNREDARPGVSPEVAARLERMEQSIDAMAIEMERIAEGQRFVTKLLAEKPMEPVRVQGARDAVREGGRV